jgi:hypothetical protein
VAAGDHDFIAAALILPDVEQVFAASRVPRLQQTVLQQFGSLQALGENPARSADAVGRATLPD